MTFSNLFQQFGTNLIVPLLLSILGFFTIPIYNLTIEEKTIVNVNIRLFRTITQEVWIFLGVLVLISFCGNLSTAKHNVIYSYPYISNLPSSHFFIPFFGITMIVLFIFLLLIRLKKKFRLFIFTKMRSLNLQRKTVGTLSFICFICLIYLYIIPPLYFLGYISDIMLLAMDTNDNNITYTTDILINLFHSFPRTTVIAFIVIYIGSYFLARIIIGQLIYVLNQFAYSKVLANITLVNGERLLNKIIIRPSVDGSLLIKDDSETANKTILPKSSILYIDFHIKQITVRLDEEVHKSSILLPPDYK